MADPRIIERDCYLFDVQSMQFLKFQMQPEITDSKSVNWNPIEIIGRSHPILGYASSGSRQIQFTLEFFAHPSKEDTTSASEVSNNIRFLQSLAYPDYNGGVFPPHRVLLTLGKQTKMIGVLSDVNVVYHTLWSNGLPTHAEVSITLIEANLRPIPYDTIRNSMGADK